MVPLTYATPLSLYSGTRPVEAYRGDRSLLLISVDVVACHGGRLTLWGVPTRAQSARESQPSPAVVASLERSLEEYADVWAELSSY